MSMPIVTYIQASASKSTTTTTTQVPSQYSSVSCVPPHALARPTCATTCCASTPATNPSCARSVARTFPTGTLTSESPFHQALWFFLRSSLHHHSSLTHLPAPLLHHSFRIHSRTHDGQKCFKCELCPYSSSVHRHLENHMLTHTGERPFECFLCGLSFRQKTLLARHCAISHKGACWCRVLLCLCVCVPVFLFLCLYVLVCLYVSVSMKLRQCLCVSVCLCVYVPLYCGVAQHGHPDRPDGVQATHA